MSQDQHHHRMDYVEFRVSGTAPVRGFYEKVFGWKMTDYGPEYTSFKDGRLAGGFDATGQESTQGTLAVIYSKDLEATLTLVQGAGAEIVKPIFEFPGGRRFHFRDPAGNELAVWSDHPAR